jgi:hypothetical protein
MSNRLGHFQRAGAYRFERVPELENPNKAAQSNHPAIVLIVAGSFSDEDADLIDRNTTFPMGQNAETFLFFAGTLTRFGGHR